MFIITWTSLVFLRKTQPSQWNSCLLSSVACSGNMRSSYRRSLVSLKSPWYNKPFDFFTSQRLKVQYMQSVSWFLIKVLPNLVKKGGEGSLKYIFLKNGCVFVRKHKFAGWLKNHAEIKSGCHKQFWIREMFLFWNFCSFTVIITSPVIMANVWPRLRFCLCQF